MSNRNLINGIRRKSERDCSGLRNYEPPSDVQVFRIINGQKELIRIEPPTKFIPPNFNGGKREK